MTKYKSRLHKGMMDWLLFGAMAGLVLLGALCIMSAVNAVSLSNAVVRTHLIALPLGFVAFFAAWSFNYQIFDEQWKPLYSAAASPGLCSRFFPCSRRKSAAY